MTHTDSLEIGFMSTPDDGFDMEVRHQVQNLQRRGNITRLVLYEMNRGKLSRLDTL